MNVAVVGSRSFNNYEALEQVLFSATSFDDTIISGGAKGTDTLAEKFANDNGIKLKVIEANWDGYGKMAGFIRNDKIIEEADYLIAFWDGYSKGTKDSIEKARKKGIDVLTIAI